MKKMTLSQILFLVIITLIVASCSSETKVEEGPKKYSSETQREFEAIENNDLRVNPPYRSTIKSPPRQAVVIKESSHVKIKEKEIDTVLAPSIDSSQLSTKNQERLQEINQNLAFFCMKHRKDGTFKNEEQCASFTKKVLAACEKKHKLINTIMVNCIKERLKKR
jgi:PBP1b-binding outer membrane lipoprotein LpoB